jgi:hypothetical protein
MSEVMERTKRGPVRLAQTDWPSLTLVQSLAHLNVQGYTVLPALLDAATIDAVKAELADLKMNVAPYSPEQKFAAAPPQWHSRTFAEIIGLPRLVAFLKAAAAPACPACRCIPTTNPMARRRRAGTRVRLRPCAC